MSEKLQIVTVDSPLQHVLKTKTEDISENEFELAKEIVDKLYSTLESYFPAAGLAAPQVGISKSVFIFSYDRDPKNLEGVINPSFKPIGKTKVEGWEGCFSVILSNNTWKLAKIPRYETIKVQYFNVKGQKVEKMLHGFAARVFQHEYDHLQGIENIDREDALVMEFNSKQDLLKFMDQVKQTDAFNYNAPQDVSKLH